MKHEGHKEPLRNHEAKLKVIALFLSCSQVFILKEPGSILRRFVEPLSSLVIFVVQSKCGILSGRAQPNRRDAEFAEIPLSFLQMHRK